MLKKREDPKQIVYSNLTDSEIFNYYFGEEVEVGRCYSSRLRKDTSPSTGFYVSKSGKLIYHDFSTGEKYDSINYVMKLFDLDYFQALNKIKDDFKLEGEGKLSVDKPKKPVKKVADISVIPREFTDNDIAYFGRYNISRFELVKNNVHSIDTLILNGKFIKTRDNELKFAYILDDEYVKVYSPYSKIKWLSTVPLNKPFGLKELPYKDDKLIITKSLKDKIVLNKFFTDVIALQNESSASLGLDTIEYLRSRYRDIYINFDNDKPGVRASAYYEENFGFKPLVVPIEYNVKDFSDFVDEYGIVKMNRLIRWMKL
jgi:hypothetical protein